LVTRGANRTSVSALFNENQFIPQYFENVSFIFSHRVVLQFFLTCSLEQQAAAPIARAWVYPPRELATHMPDGKQKALAEEFGLGLAVSE
jgi:hypothetical protein